MAFEDAIVQDNDFAMSQRVSTWDPLWQDLADLELPTMAEFTQRLSPGQRRSQRMVNEIGMLSARELATRVNAFLSGDGTTWFDLRIENQRIADDPEVKLWLDNLKRMMYMVYTSPGSGFGVAKEPTYRQLAVFGNGPMYMGESQSGFPFFRAEFLGNCSIWTDDNNRVIAVFREYQQTARGLLEQFGEQTLPHEVLSIMEKEPQKKFTMVHGVRPRRDGDPIDLFNRRWIEGYVLKEKKVLMGRPRFYWEFPWLFPRWNVTPNEFYGRGPGEDALQSVKMVQRIDTDMAKHIALNVDPQWMMDDSAGASPRINQIPGGEIYGRIDQNGNWNIQRMGPTGAASEGFEYMNAKERRIETLFYLDAFKMVEKITKEGSVVHMSATEFAGRQADQFRFAGPALERMRAEFLFPCIARTAAILIRNKKVPPPPQQLRGIPIQAEYVSPLATAQRSNEGAAILQLIGDIIPLAQIDPRALDILNVPRAGRVLAKSRHVPQEALNTLEEIADMQAARDEAAAQERQTEQMVAASGAAKNSAQALTLLEGGV